jgi:hypothetical protein
VDAAKFVHVLGAMLLLASLVLAFGAFVQARRADSELLGRLGFRALLLGALPAWVIMRVGAQWAYSEGSYEAARVEPGWIGFGFISAEGGLLLLVIATVLAGMGRKRLGLRPWSQGLVGVLIALYIVTVFAMSAQPD